ncbi:MAG: hypothetical protein AB9836_04525 [Aminipila sp.]
MNYESISNDATESFSNMFKNVRDIAQNPRYKGLSLSRIADAFGMAWNNNPHIQHTRLLRNKSQPFMYDRSDLEYMIKNPESCEEQLRRASHAFDYTSYPLYKLKQTLSSILTYRWFYMPQYIGPRDAEKEDYKTERRFVDKFCKKLDPSFRGRIIAEEALTEGKIFKYIRHNVDKSHNKVYAVELMDLPSDWCKIVGRNSESYYTVSFNMTYFWSSGASLAQFPPIFTEYAKMLQNITEFSSSTTTRGKKRRHINMAKAAKLMSNHSELDISKIGGSYFFWVDLPVDECFVFGTDFTSPIQAPMLMGLFLSAQDLSSYEYLQPQLLQMPLYAILTGEIPFNQEKNSTKKQDDYKLSPTARTYFESIFYEMMASNNTRGVDIFMAPAENLKLQNLQEVPNGGKIVTTAYQDFLTKAGITGIQSSTDKPMAGMVATSQKIEARYADLIYCQFANMMNITLEKLGLNYEWRFVMFGDIFSEKDMLARAKEGMTLGILADTYIYNAILGRTIEDDVATSYEMMHSGILNMRIPLVSSYSAKQGEGTMPPQPSNNRGRDSINIDDVTNEETEESLDKGTGENL